MNQEQCLKQNMIHIRSAKGLRGFRWQKRVFKLYHDRIVYFSMDSEATRLQLGEIPLCCITAVIDYEEDKKQNRFDIILGAYRIYQLLTTTPSIAIDWCHILRSFVTKYSTKQRDKILKHEMNKFWNIESGLSGGSGSGSGSGGGGSYVHNNFDVIPQCDNATMMDDDGDPTLDDGGDDSLPPMTTALHGSKSSHVHHTKKAKHKKRINKHKRGAKSNNFTIDDKEDSVLDTDMNGERRLSVMNTILPSKLTKYTVLDALTCFTSRSSPFGVVGIVSYQEIETPLLLQICSKSSGNYGVASSVMDRMNDLINPYIITQLQRGATPTLSFACYNCPSMGCLTNILHLFRSISMASLRIICAEILCALEYLHESNFNFPNLSPHSIYISHESHIVLTDFGFAVPNQDHSIYRSGPLCYAPPEFLSNAIDDIKSDWWRLGVLIYHLCVGKPPFVGEEKDICHQICHSLINRETLFDRNHYFKQNQQNIDINPQMIDLIMKLLCRERKERLCLNSKRRNRNGKRSAKQQVELIMSHPFFERINNKKHKDYPYNWQQIRKRQHKPAPILRHLADRPSYVMQNIMDSNDSQSHSRSLYDDAMMTREREGSIIDTTDDEEFIVSDIDDEYDEKQLSHSNTTNTQKTPSDEHYLYSNDPQNSSMSANSGPYMPSPPQSFSPQQPTKALVNSNTPPASQPPHAIFANPFKPNPALTPLPQSGSAQIQAHNASATPPPTASKNNPFFKPHTAAPSPIGVHGGGGNTREAMTPMSAAFTRHKPKVLPIHRKRLSSRLGTPSGKPLPPGPVTAPGKKSTPTQPHLNQSQAANQQYPNNDPEYDDRFSNYVKHQQFQMGIEHSKLPRPPPKKQPKQKPPNRIMGGYGVAPTTHNLPGYYEPKKIDDASTIVSDQIAAAAALRHPILSQKQREKEKKKSKKKKTKKKDKNRETEAFNRRNMTDDEIHKKQAKTLPQIQSGKKPPRKKGLDELIRAKADALLNKKIRSKVSKKKRRFIDKVHGFDLDLTYITKRIIAMGFPAQGNEAVWRNPTDEVKRFFNTYHRAKFKVYNLCIEKDRQYPDSKFSDIGGKVARYQFKDHNSPELELILRFCEDLHEWFMEDKKNVAAIHCKAGKGRTGVMICSYLAYAKICKDAADALKKYGMARTKNAKGVTIPSQRRWVLYFIDYVMNPKICPSPKQFDFYKVVTLKKIRMHTIPDFDIGGGCDPYFTIVNIKGELLYDYSEHNPVRAYKSSKKRKKKKSFMSKHDREDATALDVVKFCPLDIVLRGAFKMVFYDKDKMSKDDMMCWCWLHSSISVRQKYIKLERDDIDQAVKDKAHKYFAEEFCLEFWFESPLDEVQDKSELMQNQPHLSEWITANMNVSLMRVKSRERREARTKKPRTHTHSAVPPPPSNLGVEYGNEINYPSQSTAQAVGPAMIQRTQTEPLSRMANSPSNQKPILNQRSSEKSHLDPWKKKLGKKFQIKRHSASHVLQNVNEINQNPNGPHDQERSKRKKKRHKHKSEQQIATAVDEEEDGTEMIRRVNTTPVTGLHVVHNEERLDYAGANYGNIQMEYAPNNKGHERNKSAQQHTTQRDRNNHKHRKNTATDHQRNERSKRRKKPMKLMNHKSAGPAAGPNHQRAKTGGNAPTLSLAHHNSVGGASHSRNKSANSHRNGGGVMNSSATPNKLSKMQSLNAVEPSLRLNNNSSHNRNMSANNADQYHNSNQPKPLRKHRSGGNINPSGHNYRRNKHQNPISPIDENQMVPPVANNNNNNHFNPVVNPKSAPPYQNNQNNQTNQNRNPYNAPQNQYNNNNHVVLPRNAPNPRNQFHNNQNNQFQPTNRMHPRNQYPNQYINNATQSYNMNSNRAPQQNQSYNHKPQKQYQNKPQKRNPYSNSNYNSNNNMNNNNRNQHNQNRSSSHNPQQSQQPNTSFPHSHNTYNNHNNNAKKKKKKKKRQSHNNNNNHHNNMRNVQNVNQLPNRYQYNNPQPNPYNNNNNRATQPQSQQNPQHPMQYHDGAPVQPLSFTDTSMLATLRQNMQHLRASPNYDSDDPYDDDFNRKTTLV